MEESSSFSILSSTSIGKGWRTVLGGFIIHLVLGTLYIWGNITNVVTSYLRRFDDSITYNDTLTVYATALGFQGSVFLISLIVISSH